MPLDFTDDKSTMVQVMAWCRQATSHYLSQCWPRLMLPYGVIRPQWVNNMAAGGMAMSGIMSSTVLIIYLHSKSWIYFLRFTVFFQWSHAVILQEIAWNVSSIYKPSGVVAIFCKYSWVFFSHTTTVWLLRQTSVSSLIQRYGCCNFCLQKSILVTLITKNKKTSLLFWINRTDKTSDTSFHSKKKYYYL